MEKVEKVGLANFFHDSSRFGGPNRGKSCFDKFFHHFYDSKDFLDNSWKKWKKLAWPTFSTTQAVLEAQIEEKVGQANFLRVLLVLSMLEEEPPHFVLRNRGALLFVLKKREALFPT